MHIRYRLLSIIFIGLVASAIGLAQGVSATKHNLSATGPDKLTTAQEVCVFCHTPHNGLTAPGDAPIWNHQYSVAPYTLIGGTVYTTPTTVNDLTGSLACLSCHDGTTSIAAINYTTYGGTDEPKAIRTAGSDEFSYRHNTRSESDPDRFVNSLHRISGRLTYADLTENTSQ